MTGIASHTGSRGSAALPAISLPEMGTRKKICIRYMPNVSLAIDVMNDGARRMQVKSRKAPKVESSTLGVQNCHDHSISGVGI